MHAFEERAGETADLVTGEGAIDSTILQTRVAPFPVRRQDRGQALKIGDIVTKPGRIGVSERFADMEPNVTRAPRIIKADIKKVRTQPQLENDANCVELVGATVSRSPFDAGKERFRIVIAGPTKAAPLVGSAKQWQLVLQPV